MPPLVSLFTGMSKMLDFGPSGLDSMRASSTRSADSSAPRRCTSGFFSVALRRSTLSVTSRSAICARTRAAPLISASACLSSTITPDEAWTLSIASSASIRCSLMSFNCCSKKTRRNCASETASRSSSLATSSA